MKKIIHIVTPMWPSPSQPAFGTFVKVIADGLQNERWDVRKTAVSHSRRTGLLNKIERHGRIALGLLLLFFAPRGIVYVHSPTWFAVPLLLLRKIRSMPIVVNIHGSEIHGRNRLAHFFWPSMKSLIRKAELVVVPSNTFAKMVEEVTSAAPDRLFVSASGGVAEERFSVDGVSISRAELKFPSDAIVLGYVSRIVQGKRWRLFLDVVQELRSTDSRIRGIMIGTGEDAALLDELRRRNLEMFVRFIGPRTPDQLAKYYRCMDIFLFTSAITSVDSLGLVALEALSTGIPVVALDSEITREYVRPNENGMLVTKNDASGYAEATRSCLSQVESGKFSKGAIVRTVMDFRSSRVISRLSGRFEEIWKAFYGLH